MRGTDDIDFSISYAREIVGDLFEPHLAVYWADLLLTWSIAAASFLLAATPRFGVIVRTVCFLVSSVAWYRSAAFIHELAHLRGRGVRPFRVVWNVVCGVPLLIPSFLYETHVDHHAKNHYGTVTDGEYVAWARQPPAQIVKFVAFSFIAPLLAVLRFAVLTPLSWASRGWRRRIHRRASALVVTPDYTRQLRVDGHPAWWLEEAGCLLYLAAVALALLAGRLIIAVVVQAYVMAVLVVLINAARVLGAHRYRNTDGEMTFVEQMADSVTYPRHAAISALWAPVGLRFHALHHLFPSMPYHALGEAHRRLVAHLPADSPYCRTISPGLMVSLRTLLRESMASRHASRPNAAITPGLQTAPRSDV